MEGPLDESVAGLGILRWKVLIIRWRLEREFFCS